MPEEMERPQDERDPRTGFEAGTEETPLMENPIPDRPYTERRSSGFQGGSWEERAAAEPPPAQPLIVNYCRVCGRGLTAAETAHVQGAVYCPEHAPRMQPGYGQAPYPPPPAGAQGYRAPEGPSPYSAPMGSASPGLAFLLGLIPGVGAVYNAQYVKAIVHVVVFGLLVSILSSGAADGIEPLFGMLAAIWYFYMPFEAYHTARKRTMGLPVDDISSIFPMQSRSSGIPVGPVILIALGVIFLLAQFDLISFGALLRYWPVLLIVAGGWMLYERMALKGQGS